MLTIPNGIVLTIGLGMAIVGILLATHTMPETTCLGYGIYSGSSSSDSSARDDVNSYAFLGGMPTVIAALLAIIGGVLGAIGGVQKSMGMVGCTVALMYIVVLLSVICFFVSMLGNAIGDVYSEEYYTCPDGDTGEEMCVGTVKNMYGMACKTDVDSFRSYAAKSQAGMAFAAMLAIASLFAGIFDCSACCCCPDNYEMKSQPKQPVGAPVTYGQPAENAQ